MDTGHQADGVEPSYGFTERLPGVSLADAKARITRALAIEGFGVMTEIDVRQTLWRKLGAEFRPYVILGACDPRLAQRALEDEIGIGLLLPCNVCIWQEGTTAVISIADPAAMFHVADNPRLQPIADEAARRLRRALASLLAST